MLLCISEIESGLVDVSKPEEMHYVCKMYTGQMSFMSHVLYQNTENILIQMRGGNIELTNMLKGWLNRVEFIASHYTKRLNTLALFKLIVHLPPSEPLLISILEIIIPVVEAYIFLKISIPNSPSLYSPIKGIYI